MSALSRELTPSRRGDGHAGFADFGHHVTCVDKDAGRIAALKRGEIPIFEPGLADLVATNMAQERLSFSAASWSLPMTMRSGCLKS